MQYDFMKTLKEDIENRDFYYVLRKIKGYLEYNFGYDESNKNESLDYCFDYVNDYFSKILSDINFQPKKDDSIQEIYENIDRIKSKFVNFDFSNDAKLFENKKELFNVTNSINQYVDKMDIYLDDLSYIFRNFIAYEENENGLPVYLTKKEIENNEENLEWEIEINDPLKNYLEWKDNFKNYGDSVEALNYLMNLLTEIKKFNKEFVVLSKLLFNINEYEKQKELKVFYDNKDFMKELNKIMKHSEDCVYYFHGTQCVEDAFSILKDGLAMQSESLYSTSYPNFSNEDLLLYQRGFCGEIGHDAVVVIKKPKHENIVEPIGDKKGKIGFCQSGLGGFDQPNFIIPSKYIVGFVNKRDKKVIFNEQEMQIEKD